MQASTNQSSKFLKTENIFNKTFQLNSSPNRKSSIQKPLQIMNEK
jgi:hypothetical protein